MAEERIQKIMAEQGLCSRRAAEQIIAEGRVKVNGHPVKVGDKMDPNRDVLHVDDERIYIQKNQQLYYLALYKPRGYVTTASDELGRKTVMDLVSDIPARLYPVGRLDKDSEGLLLTTVPLHRPSPIRPAVSPSCTALPCSPAPTRPPSSS